MNMTAQQQVERAYDLRRRDILAHRWADMAVAVAMEESRKNNDDPERRPMRFAHDVATLATTILIDKLITEDQAIATLTVERDHYKKIAEEALGVLPTTFQIRTVTGQLDASDSGSGA